VAGPRSGRFRTRGHLPALAAIERAVGTGRVPHALLISGPAHVGKTTLALDLAAGLLCTAPRAAGRPCRDCAACRKVDAGNHPDLHRLAPEGAGGQVRLAQVQGLISELALLPLEGAWRVAIVESAHRLNPDAQNALLKTLEEPPQAAVIVLAADDETQLLPTVRSRCARLRLGPVAPEAIAGLLEERGLGDRPKGAALARLAGGRPGLALGLALDDDARQAHERVVRTLIDLRTADRRTRLSAVPALLADAALIAGAGAAGPEDAAEEAPAARARGPAPAERRGALLALLGVWRELARDLAVAQLGGREVIRHLELLEEIGAAPDGSGPRLRALLADIDGLAMAVEGYANPELTLDALLLRWGESTPPRAVA
jgi:DNA polymerase III delta' subunit